MRDLLEKEIKSVLVGLGVQNPKVSFDYPARMDFGDLSTNVAMAYAKELGKNPHELAEDIKVKLAEARLPQVAKIEMVGGFINFFFDVNYFSQIVSKALSDGYGSNENMKGQKIIIEYTVTNVLKPMHIGHLMGNVIGESLSRIFEYSGAEVKRNNYQGDSGLHVAKAVWGIMKLGGIKEGNLSEKNNYIGNSYVVGANSYEDNPEVAEEIKEINKKLFSAQGGSALGGDDAKFLNLYKWGRKVSLDHFEELYKKLGTKFDFYFFESEVADDALKIVREFIKKGVFEESEGAVVFHGEKYDPKLHTRVFINSHGLPMYEAKDVAHAIRKYEAYKFDKSIIITANEQNEYFKVVLRALQEINLKIAEKTEHISHGLLKLPTGKMSARKGNVITGEELISDIEEKVLEKINSREEMSKAGFDTDETAEIVAIGAIKYSILRQAVGGDIIFDFDKSISFEGDSGPYLQYACVRANSLLKKAPLSRRHLDINLLDVGHPKKSLGAELPNGWVTTDLERLLERFPSVVERARVEYAPHYIVTYLIELAGEFNSFYASHKIIPARLDDSSRSGGDETDPTSPYRLALTQAFVFVMVSGLNLLGIKVPERM